MKNFSKLRLFKTNQGQKVVSSNKMYNPRFVDEEDIPMVHKDDDYDDYNTPDASRMDQTSFTLPDTTETTSTLRQTQKVKQDKLSALYIHLSVTGNLDLINFNQFTLTTDKKKESQFLSFTIVIDGFL